MKSTEVILFMEKCSSGRMVANKTMLCTRNIFLLENMRDIRYEEYNEIIRGSGNAGIIRM